MIFDLFSPPARMGATFDPDLDALRLGTATARVFALLMDGRWHTGAELREVGGDEGTRRARDLRDPRLGRLALDVERVPGLERSGLWRYRLGWATEEQLQQAKSVLVARGRATRKKGEGTV